MRLRIIVTTGLFGLVCLAAQAQEGGGAKVGDWVSYKQSITFVDKEGNKGKEIVGAMKQTVAAKDEKFISVKTESTSLGITKESESKMAIDELGDPAKLYAAKGKGKIEKKKSGEEEIDIDGKKHKTEWTTFTITGEVMGKSVDTSVKIWTSRDVPLAGVVKMETDTAGAKVSMELTAFGRGK